MLLIKDSFVFGINKSSLPNEIPALNACLNPNVFILSQKITVSFWPQNLNIVSITSDTFFFVKSLFTVVNFILLLIGKTFANKNLPAVLVYFSITGLLSLSTVLNVEIIFECKLIDLFSRACSISSMFKNKPLGFFSFSLACDK